jgi:glycosyltransferase involved in cell wall biosynthesis
LRIGIDVRYLSHGLMGGIHTYLMNLLPELACQAAAHELLLYADTKAPFDLEGRLPDNAQLRRLDYSGQLSALQNDWRLGRHMASDGVDVAHFPANYGLAPTGVPSVITLHDALTVMPLGRQLRGKGSKRTLRSTAMMVHLSLLSSSSVRRANRIVTISQHAADEITGHIPEVRERMSVIYHGVPADARPVKDEAVLAEVRSRLALPRRFLLADALKNPAAVLAGWRTLPDDLRRDVRIVFYARTPDLLPAVQEAVDEGAALLLLRPSRQDLIALYTMAELFCFPSWIEGFGLPVLEAMACGASVIASDRSAIPEIAGDAALIADAEESAAIGEYMRRILTEADLRESLRTRGFARAATFTWARAARQMLDVYESLAKS